MIKVEKLKEQLKFDLDNITKSVEMLNYSLNKAKQIGIKASYTMEELEVFESLSGRYARTADILTQKVIKNIFYIMQEEAKTFIDRCNLAEKLEIVQSADTLYNIRKLRNDIAHEYCITDITEHFDLIIEYSDELLDAIQSTKHFTEKM